MAEADKNEMIVCHIDGERTHSIKLYLRDNHPEWTMDRYKAEFPDAPLLSEHAKRRIAESRSRKSTGDDASEGVRVHSRVKFHELFGLGNVKAAMSASGQPIEMTVLGDHSPNCAPYLPDLDPDYIFNIDLTKKVLVGMELNKAVYLWGYHGTGKTTVFEQFSARTKRPFMRVQHTATTEESHILGQYVVKSTPAVEEVTLADGTIKQVVKHHAVTEFQLGPLPTAMIEGMVYCADEYDFAQPAVVAVYQAVLEGKPLIIKEAPEEFRVIRPHPDFRFVATGNTNGVGDETGLYQGTLIQNAANYSRFGIVEEVKYMDEKLEEGVLMSKARIDRPEASKFVTFATSVRKAFMDGNISSTISPRELINAAELGICFANWRTGIELAYSNRLSRVDKKTVDDYAQRIFG